jgi:protein TonB
METKKNPRLDLRKKNGLFFNLGLIISLGLVISAFEWKFYDDLATIELDLVSDEPTQIIDVPITNVTPPPPIKAVVMPEIVAVPEEKEDLIKEIFDQNELENTNFEKVKLPEITTKPDDSEPSDDPIIISEVMPEFEGGLSKFYDYVGKSIKYPKQASRMSIEGKVFVQFVIDKDGGLSDLKVLKGIGGGCDEEALRVLKESPKWKPGKQRGRPVRVKMSLPISFKLN